MAGSFPDNYWGKFRHFKGKDYFAYGLAHDQFGDEYVLYQQLYDTNDFWVRPRAMFDERVNSQSHPGTVQRFSRIGRDRISQEQGAAKIKALMEQGPLILHHSESLTEYAVSSISSDSTFNIFLLDEAYNGGYLTDYQLAKRMGYFLAYLNGKYVIHEFPKDKKVSEAQKLIVDHESTRGAMIVSQIGAASIDLRIADNGFLKTKNSTVDLVNLTHITNAKSLWKKVKLKKTNSKSENFFELRKGESIITHTLERIRIPLDCAGKIEIRSTYARLSLSVTTGDYCNPGYHGYYPLVLRNDGKHTIRIHPREAMVQLILVSLCGVVIKDYPTRASFANSKGIDEGNPYDFYRTDIVKRMRKVIGYEDILEIYHATLGAINANNTDDPAQTKERFTDVFLSYCSAHLQKKKYRKEATASCNQQYDTYELWKDFTQREKRIKSLFSLKTKLASAFIPIASWVTPIFLDNNITVNAILPWGIPVTILYIAAIVILLCLDPKVYCTCERIDYDTLRSPPPTP